MSEHVHDIQKEVKGYLIVGGSLLFLTIVTVAVSYLHLNLVGAIILALIVATIKGSLVACYFMHLITEQKLIYITLVLTVIFFAGMMGLIVSGQTDHLIGTQLLRTEAAPSSGVHH